MYAWIWRKLPFGLPGKFIGSAVLILAFAATLWFWGFPAAEPILPFDDVNVTDQGGDPAGVDPSANPGDHDIPYPIDSNEPSPEPSR